MDNGLIFPYRLYRDPAEAEDAKRPNPLRPSGQGGGAREPNL